MDILTFTSHVLLYALIAAALYILNKRITQYLDKVHEKNAVEIKAELELMKKRISELSMKVGLKDIFKN